MVVEENDRILKPPSRAPIRHNIEVNDLMVEEELSKMSHQSIEERNYKYSFAA